ncbi:hypothetical protein [Actinomadura sp. 9N407]|uniref:hypothetical protein n=1 Tax=Actinomadura sp. 9N407 TaxID=3375154 RepID=UPI0037A49B38
MVTERRMGYLEELEHELDTRGLVGRVVRTRSGPAFLRVVNPDAASLAEDVTCAPAPESHDHYYWWSWGERMHRVDDPGGAAVKLAHVLQPLYGEAPHGEAPYREAPYGEGCRGRRPDSRNTHVRPPETAVEWPAGHS